VLILVSGATKTVDKMAGHPNLGQLITPHDGNKVRGDMPWAADNAAFSNWDRVKWLSMLRRIAGTDPLFVVAPDVVCDAMATLARLKVTSPMIRKRGFRVACALQNGQEWIGVRRNYLDAIFIGGDTEFKLGAYARHCVRSAKERGDWVHMGRVNSLKRLQYAREIGCDSVDGSGYSMFPDTKLIPALRYLETEQLALF
jgi:hypothetical protein